MEKTIKTGNLWRGSNRYKCVDAAAAVVENPAFSGYVF